MFRNLIRRNLRQPVAALAVLLLYAVLTVVLCHLYKSERDQIQSYTDTYASVPVFFKVVDLDGSKPKDFSGINGWTLDLMDSDWLEPSLYPYVKELHLRISLQGTYRLEDSQGKSLLEIRGTQTTVGVSSTRVAEELTEGWGGKIFWHEGYDEHLLMGSDYVCIVPESMKHYQQIDMAYHYDYWPTDIVNDLGGSISMDVSHTFRIVGYYTDPGNTRIYCPYETLNGIHAALQKKKTIQEIGAILNDNTLLPQLKADAAQWFATPTPLGEPTAWGKYGYENYLYALDIDDALLTAMDTNLQNSLQLNHLFSVAIWFFSAGAGFLTGFLVIRARKRDIALMRALGTSQSRIFTEFLLEQMLCVFLGIALGGGYTLWQPLKDLVLLGLLYIVSLFASLTVFLRKNLLTTVKEDE